MVVVEKIRVCARDMNLKPGYWLELSRAPSPTWSYREEDWSWPRGGLNPRFRFYIDYVAFPLIAYRAMAKSCLASNTRDHGESRCDSAAYRKMDIAASWTIEFECYNSTGEVGFDEFCPHDEGLYRVAGPEDLLSIAGRDCSEHTFDFVMYGGNDQQLEAVGARLARSPGRKLGRDLSQPTLSELLKCGASVAVIRSPNLAGEVHTMSIWGGLGLKDRLRQEIDRFEAQVVEFSSRIKGLWPVEDYVREWENLVHDRLT